MGKCFRNSAVKVFMERDGMSKDEAINYWSEIRKEIYEILGNGGSYDEVEDLLMCEGLEMDYAMDFI